MATGSIGVFDSGYGGLTVLRELIKVIPEYNYIYLGDNARAPYGSRSFESVYEYTLQAVNFLFDQDCPLILLACNTASAKALKTIQQKILPITHPNNRVLGVIRPTSEDLGNLTKTRKVGILGTSGTINSNSYITEINHFFPDIKVFQNACPMLVPLVENDEYDSTGADFFIKKYIRELLMQDKDIDTIVLACTHYPLLYDKIKANLPDNIYLLSQGEFIAQKTKDYLLRHPEMDARLNKSAGRIFYTTDSPELFDIHSSIFFGESIHSKQISLHNY